MYLLRVPDTYEIQLYHLIAANIIIFLPATPNVVIITTLFSLVITIYINAAIIVIIIIMSYISITVSIICAVTAAVS